MGKKTKKQQATDIETTLQDLWWKWWRAKTKEDKEKYQREYREVVDNEIPKSIPNRTYITGFEIVGILRPILNGKELYRRRLIKRIPQTIIEVKKGQGLEIIMEK